MAITPLRLGSKPFVERSIAKGSSNAHSVVINYNGAPGVFKADKKNRAGSQELMARQKRQSKEKGGRTGRRPLS
jgi:hypothetical protein